ncbi:glycerophosphodiester phosphodiesterase family protein [Paenibacillus allorhizosphaerae]|uniref:GP-PDE domain-containing protein n=1 Tax=Paenibacillus allorhizosphaerae TaxID=2849866 RepID=A0ABN7TLJ5_9BACL|nr:glycerophosphodiester phosphodiesterase family protein [Paenibacillus allorhizosphaerae]CAG7645691.1 hypothetical protein PAECIP111802_03580 [Paenibacillus allorhizosphaerae]
MNRRAIRSLGCTLTVLLLSLGVGCASSSSLPAKTNADQANGKPQRIGRAAFTDKNSGVWVVAHMSDWRNHSANSLSGIQGAIDMGVHIVEVDVQLTKDHVPILMHDETVDKTTNGTGKVADMTLAEIKSLYLKQRQGGDNEPMTSERVPTLKEAMELAKGKVMVNLDKGWVYRDAMWDVLVQTGTSDHGIFKSAANNLEVESWLKSKSPRPLYVQVMLDSHLDKLDALLQGAKPDAFELVFGSKDAKVIADETLTKIRKSGAKLWVNTMMPSQIAGMKDVETTWDWSIGKGVQLIQTDAPSRLLRYLKKE